MILKITEECLTDEFEFAMREYEYITAEVIAEDAIKSFLFDFDVDRVVNCNDLFDGECLSSEIRKIEVIPYEEI